MEYVLRKPKSTFKVDPINLALKPKLKPGETRSSFNKRKASMERHRLLSLSHDLIASNQEYSKIGFEAGIKSEYHQRVANVIQYEKRIPSSAEKKKIYSQATNYMQYKYRN
jgi:hypothetical protein